MTIWHVLVIAIFALLVWGGLKLLNRHGAKEANYPDEPPDVRMGGWLSLLVIGLVILGPLVGAGRMASEIGSAERQYPALLTLAHWSTFKLAAWATFGVAALAGMAAGIRLGTSRRRGAVATAIGALWLGPIGGLFNAVIWPGVIFQNATLDPQDAGGILGACIVAGIWTAFLLRSKRVKARYTEGVGPVPTVAPGAV